MSQNYTTSGTVTDAATGETLIGATVLDVRSGKGTVTNAYGDYSLTLKKDSITLKFSYVGYEPQQFAMRLDHNMQLSVKLKPSVQLNEVVVTAERTGDTRSSQMSATQMTMEKIKSVPVMFGEADIIKALQLMPGVQSGSEGNSGMYVRGGGPDENLSCSTVYRCTMCRIWADSSRPSTQMQLRASRCTRARSRHVSAAD